MDYFTDSRDEANRGAPGDEMAKNIYYRAWTEPNAHGGGYVAFWGSPGLNPAVLRDPDGNPSTFPTEAAGELAAWRRMAEVLNKPRSEARSGKPERYQKMSGPEFAGDLQDVGITPSFFAYLYGTSQARAINWIDNVPGEDVPHPARILLGLFKADPVNIDIAEAITARITTERQPRRQETG